MIRSTLKAEPLWSLVMRPASYRPAFRKVSLFRKHPESCLCCSDKPDFLKSQNTDFSTFDSISADDGVGIDSNVNVHVRSLLENNRKWVISSTEKDPNFLNSLRSPQQPQYLYFGCSDSRVPANEILGLGPGEVFVHRNVGNLVLGNDLNALSVLEYAVGHLDVKDIIVTGHYDCGAIRAATSRQDLGTLENWLRMIRDVYRLHKEYLDLIYDVERRHASLVELNVIEQCLNIYKAGIVQRKRLHVRQKALEAGMSKEEAKAQIYPRIHGLVFDTSSGLLKSLPVDFDRRVGTLDHIYGLYSTKTKKT